MPVTIERRELDRHDRRSGRWVTMTRLDRSIRVAVGTTGNPLDQRRRVRLVSHEFVAHPQVALRTTWPVREVSTDRVAGVVDDLRAELAAAGSSDPDDDLGLLHRWWTDLLAPAEAAGGRERTDERRLRDVAGDVLRRAYPLLDAPLAAGARPRAVPIVVEGLLHCRDPRMAVRHAFGRPTRPLIRALATALLPDQDGSITWEPVLLALMAAGRCGPEQLADILATPVDQPGAVSFSHLDIERARAMAVDRDPGRVAEWLRTALREPGGTTRLAAELCAWDARPPAPPPVDAAPRQEPLLPEAGAARRDPTHHDPGQRPTPYPRRFRAVEGMEVAGHRVELVARPDDLLRWGEQLANCLGAYRTPVARATTHILGLTWHGELRIAAEISPSGALRQLEAAANTRPRPALEAEVIAFLRRHRLMEVDARHA